MRRASGFIIFLIIIAAVTVIGETEGCSGDVDGDVRVIALDYKAVIVDEPGSRGKAVITELLTFDVRAHSRNYLIYELWRELPEEYVDGVKVEYNVISVRQIFEDGSYVIFEETPNLYWWDRDYVSTEPGYGPGNWHHSGGPYDGRHNWESVIFYVDGLYHETVHFEVVYEMYNASLRYNDASEFYVTLYYGDTIRHLQSVRGQILFPLDIMPGEGNYYASTFGTNSHGFPFTESTTVNHGYHTFSFELDSSQLRFRPYNRYIEFALIAHGDDKHIFTQYAEENFFHNTDKLAEIRHELAEYESLPGRFRLIQAIVLISLTALALLTFYIVFAYDKRLKKKYNLPRQTSHINLYRDIPGPLDPCFAASLAFSKHKKSDCIKDGYAAVMLSLVQKGYIELEQIRKLTPVFAWEASNINLVVNPDLIQQQNTAPNAPAHVPQPTHFTQQPPQQSAQPTQEFVALKQLTQTEELYFNLILRHANHGNIRLDAFQHRVSHDYSYTGSFVKNVKDAIRLMGTQLGYYLKADYRQVKDNARGVSLSLAIIGALIMLIPNLISYQTRLGLAFGAFFIFGLGFIAAAIYLMVRSKEYILFSKLGADEYAKWRGLYNFLNSETLIKERTVLELPIWECYLVYGTAFGISQKVITALKIRCPHIDMTQSPVLRNPYFRSHGFYSHSLRFRSATRNASFASSTGGGYVGGWSSGSGGWGGYGGGGRGGGGGGGGH